MPRTRIALVLLCALVLAGAACSSPKDTGFPPVPTASEGEGSPSASASGPTELSGPIDVVDSAYAPVQAKVKIGTTVEWKQTGAAPHTVTADPGQKLKFDSNPKCNVSDPATCLGTGSSFTFTFTAAGEYRYYCRIHGAPNGVGMSGVVIVE